MNKKSSKRKYYSTVVVSSTCDQRKWREIVQKVCEHSECPNALPLLKGGRDCSEDYMHTAQSTQSRRLFFRRPNWIPPPHPQSSVAPPPFGSTKGVDTLACGGGPIPTKRRHSGTLCILLSLYGYISSHQRKKEPQIVTCSDGSFESVCSALFVFVPVAGFRIRIQSRSRIRKFLNLPDPDP
jgi:hypothetical protein